MAHRLARLGYYLTFFLFIPFIPCSALAQEEARVDLIERPADWMIISFMVVLIGGIYLFRRMSLEQRTRRLMLYLLRRPEAIVPEQEFFKIMSHLTSRPKNFKTAEKYYVSWRDFAQTHPDKKHGQYASSLMAATLAMQGLKENKLSREEAVELLQKSLQQSKNFEKVISIDQKSFIKLVIAQGYDYLSATAPDQERAEPFFQEARWNLITALHSHLRVFQMIGILQTLSLLYQTMGAKVDDPKPYFQQALDYLQMALAVSPYSRTVFPMLNALCSNWAKLEDDPLIKEQLQKLNKESRLGQYQLESFTKDLWLVRLAALMNNENTCRGKLEEMRDAQEEKLHDAMLANDHYLRRFREKPWFKQIAEQAHSFRRQTLYPTIEDL